MNTRSARAAAVLVALLVLTGCQSSKPTTKKSGGAVKQADARPQIIALARQITLQTGIKLTPGTYLRWENCNDDNGPPYQATVNATFAGKPTLVESEQQVDEWVATLERHGWSKPARIRNSAARYLSGPDGFSLMILPHRDPEVNPGSDLLLHSACNITEDLSNSRTEDLTTQLK